MELKIIAVVVVIGFLALAVVLWAACARSSQISREEERHG